MNERSINVTATSAVKAMSGAGKPDWEVDGAKPNAAVTEFKQSAGQTKVHFHLHDNTGAGWGFDCREPFWDQKECADDCPPDGSRSDQSKVLACESKKLTVLNNNSETCTVKYKLNVVNDAGDRDCVDPEWKNGVSG